jgi:hypothetical protein
MPTLFIGSTQPAAPGYANHTLYGTMRAMLITPGIRQTLQWVARRRLAAPILLFIAAHKPLLFITGQALYIAAPVAGLCGATTWVEWAALLSAPEAHELLVTEINAQNAYQQDVYRQDIYQQDI